MKLLGVLEGLLFVVGDEGVTLKEICETLEIDENTARRLLTELKKEYESELRGVKISFLGETFKLTTKKEHKEYYQKLVTTKEAILSQAQLEVLAIIAYNEPITRIEIDEIRGISSAYVVKKLLSKDLIKVVGKSDLPGKPNLYRTTREFLDCFGLSSINDLPDLAIKDNDEEKALFSKKNEVEELL
ncbi:MAG: SMC-Scp complex subunit ScpB [Firmicutes bacterium]|nr:SMC-Scp complex subunit ScpB [Bacillota bacterium]